MGVDYRYITQLTGILVHCTVLVVVDCYMDRLTSGTLVHCTVQVDVDCYITQSSTGTLVQFKLVLIVTLLN